MNAIDVAVFGRLKQLGVPLSASASDSIFLRRAYLDVIGTVPTVDEAKTFLADRDPNKRTALIDHLLDRPEFAEFWAMRWSEVLRVKSEFPINLWPNAVQAYHRWIYASVRDNVPYDRFVRTMLTESGSNFRVGPVNFYRALQSREPASIASTVALTFMGQRVERWPRQRLAEVAMFFSQIGYKPTGEWKEEIVYFDAGTRANPGAATGWRTMTLPDGTSMKVAAGRDPREAFADWLTGAGSPVLARALANRLWFWLFGRGIVEEADDIRPDNPPSNPELLALLEREVIASRYDVKKILRLMLTSTTYQLSPIPRSESAEADANFAFAHTRPLEAAVLVDALCQITGTTEQYASAIPEPYTFIPPDVRTIALADGSISSTPLETFGRSPRDSGKVSETTGRPTVAQRLYLLNSADVQRKIQQGPRIQALLQAKGDARELVTNLYLAILARTPTEDEWRVVSAYSQAAGNNRRTAALDLVWALLNGTEFRFRH